MCLALCATDGMLQKFTNGGAGAPGLASWGMRTLKDMWYLDASRKIRQAWTKRLRGGQWEGGEGTAFPAVGVRCRARHSIYITSLTAQVSPERWVGLPHLTDEEPEAQ